MVWDPKKCSFWRTHWYHIFQPCQDHVWFSKTNSGYFGDVSNFERLAMIPDESTNQKTMKISHNLRQKHYEKAAGQTGNMKDGRGDIRSSENQQNWGQNMCRVYMYIYILYDYVDWSVEKKNQKIEKFLLCRLKQWYSISVVAFWRWPVAIPLQWW